MQNKMLCPKCGKEMQAGALGPTEKGSLFWADNEYFKKKFNNFMTLRNALNNGAIRIRVGNGLTSNNWISSSASALKSSICTGSGTGSDSKS